MRPHPPIGSSRSRPSSRRTTGTTSRAATRSRPTTSRPGTRCRRSPASTCARGSTASRPDHEDAFAEANVYQPSFLEGLGVAAGRGAARGLEGVAALPDRARRRRVPVRRVRRRELRVLRHAAHRGAGQPRALEARRRPRRGGDGRGDRPRLRRAPLPAGRQGRDGRARREPHRGVPPEHRRARVDEPRDARARAREARRLHAEDRLPGQVARLLDARDRRRSTSSATCGARTSTSTTASSARSASRSTATSGT